MVDLQVANLASKGLLNHCPVSNLYSLSGGPLDGNYVLVTVKDPDELRRIFAEMSGATMSSHVSKAVDVFLCDENAAEIYDADGDISNGMTAYASTDVNTFRVITLPSYVDSHSAALNFLGYTVS